MAISDKPHLLYTASGAGFLAQKVGLLYRWHDRGVPHKRNRSHEAKSNRSDTGQQQQWWGQPVHTPKKTAQGWPKSLGQSSGHCLPPNTRGQAAQFEPTHGNATRLEFSGPLSRKRLVFPIQALRRWTRKRQAHRKDRASPRRRLEARSVELLRVLPRGRC